MLAVRECEREIGGEYYWGGGFTGNPAIFRVIYGCNSCDILLVHLTPTSPQSIFNQIEEISFNGALMRKLRVIAQVRLDLIDEGQAQGT